LLAPHLVGLAVFLGCQGAANLLPALKMDLFCWPAAMVAALFLGTSVSAGYLGEPLLGYGWLEVQVAESCSGFDFFALLLAVLCGAAVRHGVRAPWHWAAFLPAAGVITLAGNAARIVCSVQIRAFAQSSEIALPNDLVHFTVGAAVFATLLTACCYAVRCLYEHDSLRSVNC
jgi:exosortase/archaeosortase family protein